jgi:hypothetical protein
MAVDQASAFEQTLARIRERYALYFYLPEGMQTGEEHSVEVLLTDAARRRYPGAEIRYRRAYLAPNGANDTESARPIRMIHLPLPKRGTGDRFPPSKLRLTASMNPTQADTRRLPFLIC